jgi:hypothetical protein
MKTLILALLVCAGTAFGQTATNSVVLTFTASTSVNPGGVGYNIGRSTVSEQEVVISPMTQPNGVTCTGTSCTYTDSGTATRPLVPGTTYFYVVWTVFLDTKAKSGPSNEAVATIPTVTTPNPPTGLTTKTTTVTTTQ